MKHVVSVACKLQKSVKKKYGGEVPIGVSFVSKRSNIYIRMGYSNTTTVRIARLLLASLVL